MKPGDHVIVTEALWSRKPYVPKGSRVVLLECDPDSQYPAFYGIWAFAFRGRRQTCNKDDLRPISPLIQLAECAE